MDIKSLETKLGKDKAYSRASGFTEKERAMGFVCPRADAYGSREGVIPPGVAAVRGLVPRGMKHISPSDVARHANEARDNGVSDIDQYREYYGRGAEAASAPRPSASPVPPVPPAPAVPPVPPAPNKNGRRKAKAASAAPSPRPTRPPVPREEGAVPRDPDDPGMFSRRPDGYRADDTLDGFYEELGRLPRGTGEAGSETIPDMVSQAGDAGEAGERGRGQAVPAPSPTHGDVAPRGTSGRAGFPAELLPAPPPDPTAAALASLVAERDQLARRVADLDEAVRLCRWKLAEYEERDKHYADIEQELKRGREPVPAETVRVALSAAEERLKVGGRGWECNIVGAVHHGRSGVSLVLTVTDPAYGSELLATVQQGEAVILSSSGRTYCTYSGRCAKIYGDAGSPDFITVLWLDAREDQ